MLCQCRSLGIPLPGDAVLTERHGSVREDVAQLLHERPLRGRCSHSIRVEDRDVVRRDDNACVLWELAELFLETIDEPTPAETP